MKDIMTRAWNIAKEGAAKFGGKASEYFAEALKMAWAEVKKVVKEAFGEARVIETTWGDKLFKVWRKYGKNRLYVNREDGKKTYGYINLDTMTFVSTCGTLGTSFDTEMIKAVAGYTF